MDYLYYIAAVLIVGLACIFAIRLFTPNSDDSSSLSDEAKRRAMPAAKFATSNRKQERQNVSVRPAAPAIAREIKRTPTPWGWANHKAINRPDSEPAGLSAAMQSITDRLVREKTLVNGGSRNPRADGSLRALLEDRYAPVNKERMTEIQFMKVKRPLLRDPSEPHDQMDNFGTPDAARISAKLQRAAVVTVPGKAPARPEEDYRYVEIKDVKQPWGW